MSIVRTAVAMTVASIVLTACASSPQPIASSPVGSDAPSTLVAFELPTTCTDMLPAARLERFDTTALVLLGGPDGLYGDDYLAESTPEQDAGGITCIWGDDSTEISSVTISVAPLTADTIDLVADQLRAQNLNEGDRDGYREFGEAGDEDGSAAIYNALRDDSWISVIETVGGEAAFEEAVLIAGEVYASVYK
jgi:hypothetical protein